jgi:hypothetical protein
MESHNRASLKTLFFDIFLPQSPQRMHKGHKAKVVFRDAPHRGTIKQIAFFTSAMCYFFPAEEGVGYVLCDS